MIQIPHTVLVVDDEQATLTMFKLFLNAFGYDVLLAQDGRTAIELVERHRPAIVFTDLKMPEMDGFQVLKEIKRLAPRTEVIVITGHGDMDLVIQALNLDATDFINKPIKRSQLESALQRAAERLQNPQPVACTVTFYVREGIGCIGIEGTLSRQDREQLLSCCEKARNQACNGILIQFSQNAAVNGTGMTELINCLAAIHQARRAVAVVGLSESFRTIFEMVGVSRFANIFDTQAEAMHALAAAGQA